MNQFDIDSKRLTFGKYRGRTPEEIAEYDPSYVVWMYDTIEFKHCTKDLRDMCEMDVRESEDEYYSDLQGENCEMW